MKATLVFLAILVVGIWAGELPEDEKLNIKHIHENCQSNPATQADESLLKQLPQNVDNAQVRAHMLCMSVGVGLQQQNGRFNLDTMRSKMSLVMSDKSAVDGLVKKCAVNKDTPEDSAVNMWMCMLKNHINYMHVL